MKITVVVACAVLVLSGIILIPNAFAQDAAIPSWIKNTAGWWATDAISETEFVNAIEFLIKENIIQVSVSQTSETSQGFPDWLVNNAGWWAARIITDSDFNFDPGYTKEGIYPCASTQLGAFHADQKCFKKTFNSHGLRGYEFEKEKPDNTFRIFTVGGSTTFGGEAVDDETWPGHLQQIINEKITGKKIEVINAGIGGATTELEYDLIKDKLLFFDPDLIIMYDGWNDSDVTPAPVDSTIRNWESVCKLGKDEGFDTIIIVQPMSMPGLRVLTEQEIRNSFVISAWSPHASLYFQKSQQYVDAFNELDKVCLKTADFRGIFDYVQEPIFWDAGHTMSFGNKIIAENVFSVISPIYFGETYSVIHNLQIGKNELGVVYAVGADLSGRNFDGLNLQNAVFDKADLSNTSFKNTNIDGARFAFADLNNSNLLDRNDLSNINLAGTDLSNVSLKGKNLSGSMLTGVDLSGKDLTGTILAGVDLSGKDLTGTILTDANLEHAVLTNEIHYCVGHPICTAPDLGLSGKDLSGAILTDLNLSGTDLTGTILRGADLSNANISGVDLSGKDLTGADLTGTILNGADLTDAVLTGANLENASLENVMLLDANLDSVNLTNANLRNTILVDANLSNAILTGADLTNVVLTGAILTGADLTNAVLTGAILNCVGHPICVSD